MASGLGSITNTLSGLDPATLAEALARQEQEDMARRTASATQTAQAAGQQYQTAAQAPAPELNPFAALIPALFGNVASVLSQNPLYQRQGQERVQESRAELLKARADNLSALRDVWSQKAQAAQRAGDFEEEAKYRTKFEQISKLYDMVSTNQKQIAEKEQETQRQEGRMALEKLRQQAPPSSGGGVYGMAFSQTDPAAIAQGIMRGDLPPNLTQYSRLAQGPIATVLAKSGYRLARAQQDFAAVNRHFATLNGRLQLQIRQSATTIMPGLDDVVTLAKRLYQISPSTRATPLNRLIVKGSREWGLMGEEAQNLATELNGQIATLIPELSNVYSAGGVPTVQAMTLAGRVLNSEWPINRILAGVNRERTNLQYRINSINTIQAVTPSSVEAGGFNAAGGGPISVKAPDGNTYHFGSQAEADAFKAKAGIK